MSQTVYSHSVRILTCEACGAPLQATLEGGSFTCDYCGVAQVVQRRLEVALAQGSTDLSESERHNRLRAQQGRVDPLPPAVATLMHAGRLRSTAEARAVWTQTRVQLARAPSFPLAEKLFYLTLALAPELPERDRRAILETAVELLPDGGHSHVFRCMLSKLATFAGDAQAAERWLVGTDERPTDLLMDSVYRLAAGSLAISKGDASRVLQLFGMASGDVPIAPAAEGLATYLRLDATERLSGPEQARAELLARVERLGLEPVRQELAGFGSLTLCAAAFGSVEAEMEARARTQAQSNADRRVWMTQSQLDSHRTSWRFTAVASFLAAAVLATLLLAVPWTLVVTGGLERDPLFGAHAKLFCPLICQDCTGPYEFHHWASRFGRSFDAIYCRRRGPDGLERGLGVSGGSGQIALTMVPFCSPLGALIGMALLFPVRRAWAAREATLAGAADSARRAQERLR